MALNAYINITGQKQGHINGSVIEKGRENSIAVHAISHSVVRPLDAASGLPTGKRMHKPFVITKELDRSSPLLYMALVSSENLTTCQVQYWTTMPGGVGGAPIEKEVYTVTLTNASIASITEHMYNNLDPSQANLPYQEEIAFTYQKIQWVWTDGGVTSGDDWEAPVV